ncbi:MAG: site-specific DNA-methyltransferase [Anaerolineae bacterium]|nr:site-specific DNA-methyltransferase [Anaerolineae bacterium]
MAVRQLSLPMISSTRDIELNGAYRERLTALLSSDLDFHSHDSGYASHNFHSFPAKFPPQLPRKFIKVLTNPGDTVLDPMAGSGTTILEAFLTNRKGIAFDIDPLAALLSRVKVTPLDPKQASLVGNVIMKQATLSVRSRREKIKKALETRWPASSRKFVDYWFAYETQIELMALVMEIEKITDANIRAFFDLVFSSIIITKNGGVSQAFDLAHTRPHRAKIVISRSGQVLLGHDLIGSESQRIKFLTKTLKAPLEEFKKRFHQNLKNILVPGTGEAPSSVSFGDAQRLPLADSSIDLIVTSPPYASNAIDYMRAHKFSLVWMGYPIDDLGQKRKEYIGGEAITNVDFERLPDRTSDVVIDVTKRDERKGNVLHRYYSEMTRSLREMFRVLKPGKAAIVVVGSSIMRERDTETHTCLADIGRSIGFEVPLIGVRKLDRNRRMMPAGSRLNLKSQIQQRMHEEYVIGFYRPEE